MTTENNKIIAEFMIKQEPTENFCVGSIGQEVGVFTGIKTEYFKYEDLKFHSDWNWLMEVVEKILNICAENDDLEKYAVITDNIPYIQQTYDECIKFINFYNKQKEE